MSASLSGLKSPKPNPAWAKLPLFDRKGWKRMAFGDFAQSNGERAEPKDAQEEIYVGLEHLDPQCLHIRRWGKGSDVIGGKLRFSKGDIIFGKRRAYQRKLAVAEFGGICSAHAMVIRAKPDLVLPDFLPFLMMSDRFMNRAVEISVGSLSPTINWTTLKLETFDLPPLDQQRRIAEILWAADEAVQAQSTLEQSAVTLRMTLLRETFKDRRDYPTCRVAEAGDVQLGQQRHPKFQTGEGSRPYLRVANVMDDYFNCTDVLSMDFAEGELAKFALEPGDILLNEGQSLELVGRCAMYDGAIRGCCFQKTLLRFRSLEEVNGEWALGYFQFCQHFGVFSSISSQTTSVAHLTAVRFKALQFPRPPLSVQEEFSVQYRSIRKNLKELRRHGDNLKAVQTGLLNEWTK